MMALVVTVVVTKFDVTHGLSETKTTLALLVGLLLPRRRFSDPKIDAAGGDST